MSGYLGRRKASARHAAAIAAPGVATVVGLLVGSTAAVAAASMYLLAVVGAAAIGGLASGIVAALLSFLGLNYYFTPPRNTFRVDKLEDLVALFVFLGVAAIVGGLFARIVTARARVERREQEGSLLNRFTSSLLSTLPLDVVVDDYAREVRQRLALARLDVELVGVRVITTSRPGGNGGERLEVPVVAGETRFGTVTAVLPDGEKSSDATRRVLGAFAGQLGLALERSRLDAEARRARTDAEVSQIRAALFSSVTHDLRTPLASIKAGVTSLLGEEARPNESQRQELLTTMLEETDRLNRVVGNLLNLARARAGGLALETELTPFEDVVEGVLTRIRSRDASARVRTMIREDVPAIWVDPIQIDQALTNILENALRHSPSGGEVTIAVAPWHAGVQVRVSDRGPGIPPEDRDRVFEPFFRRRDSSPGGTGLGLAIAKAVVTAHRGVIRIEETPGGGGTFLIELPPGSEPDGNGA